jgi:hypothetical protein
MTKQTSSRRKPFPAEREAQAKHPRETRDVALTLAVVVVAVWAEAEWLTPLLLAAPLAFYLAQGAAADPTARQTLVRRWSVTLFVMFMAATAFAPSHALESVPFGPGVPSRIDAWLDGTAAPLLGARYMLVAGLATLVLTVASAGIAGALVLATVLALNAATATILISRGYNVIQMAVVAVSPWQWCFVVGLVALYTPLSVYSRSRVLRRGGGPFVWEESRAQVLVGAGLLLLAFVLRFALGGVYTAVVRHWTI